jgi:hypothetical protein
LIKSKYSCQPSQRWKKKQLSPECARSDGFLMTAIIIHLAE